MTRLLCACLTCLLVLARIAPAQVATGTPPLGSFGGSSADIINLGNFDVHVDVPIISKAGRGMPLSYALSYDSSVWYVNGTAWTPQPNWGWRQVSEALTGYVSYHSVVQYTWCDGVQDYITIYNQWAYHDPNGGNHPFPGVTFSSCTGMSNLVYTTDGSGYQMSATAWDGVVSATVYTPSGNVIIPPVGSPSGVGTVTDSNGNRLSASISGSTTTIYDTLSSTNAALTITGLAQPTQLSYPGPTGAATVTLSYTAYPIKTNFACSASQYTSSGNVNLLTDIQLPDGNYYHFQYEDTMGYSGYKTGRIKSVQLPTSGTITYTYTGGDGVHNPIVCSDGSTPGIDRLTPDSTTPWHYSRSLVSGSKWQTTVTAPNGDVAQLNFQFSTPNYYETKRVVNTGASSVVQTVQTCYNGSLPDCTGTSITLPITRRDVYQQSPSSAGKTSKTRTDFDSEGETTAIYEYDFGTMGSGSPGALLRKTVTTYTTLPSNSLGTNISVPSQISIQDGAGTPQAQTTFTYDQGTPTTTSATPQHISVTGSRGNLTRIANGVNATLTRTFTYYDTGGVNTSTDVNGAVTTYTFSSVLASCGNTFPTNVSMPLSLTQSMSWNCAGAVQAGTTDENGQSTSVSYNDSYYWRPTAFTDALNNSTSYTYSSTSVRSVLSFNNGNSVVEQLLTLDSMGRGKTAQRRQSPTSSYYDSVHALYDELGRSNKSSLPYRGTGAQNGSTYIVATFDGANRQLTATDPGGGTATYAYNYNDVLFTVGPAPAGEITKRRQLEYDGLGRLTSVCEITSVSGSGSCGQSVSQTGFRTVYTYDVMNRIISVSQNAQGTPQTRSFGYDELGRLLYEINPENGTTNYKYDSDTTCGNYTGDLVKKTDAVGNVTCYAYDVLHRRTAITYPSGSYASVTPEKHFVYDSATVNGMVMSNTSGRLAEAYTGPSGNKITDLGFSYTVRGESADVYQKTPHSGGYFHVGATYWAHGALKQLNGLSGLPTLYYGASDGSGLDGEGRTTKINASTGQNPVTAVAYDLNNATLTGVTYGSSDSDAFTYNSNTLRMESYTFSVGSPALTQSGTLTWNSNGSLQQLVINDQLNTANSQTCNYQHDDVGRIKKVDCGLKWFQDFSLTDVFGNVYKTTSTSPGTSFTPTYSTATNRINGGYSISYDANGNLTNDGLGKTFSWDAESKPISVSNGSTTVAVTYDAMGRAVENGVGSSYTQIAYGPEGVELAVMNGTSTLVKAFLPLLGGGQAVYTGSGLAYYRHTDWLGSSRLATTPNRTLYFSGAYAPYGEDYAKTVPTDDLSFTGQNQDTMNGLYDFLYRRFSPVQGRWMSPDPAGLAAVTIENPQTWNRYAYVGGNPCNATDPLGLDQCTFNIQINNQAGLSDSQLQELEGRMNAVFGSAQSNGNSVQAQFSFTGKADWELNVSPKTSHVDGWSGFPCCSPVIYWGNMTTYPNATTFAGTAGAHEIVHRGAGPVFDLWGKYEGPPNLMNTNQAIVAKLGPQVFNDWSNPSSATGFASLSPDQVDKLYKKCQKKRKKEEKKKNKGGSGGGPLHEFGSGGGNGVGGFKTVYVWVCSGEMVDGGYPDGCYLEPRFF